MSETLTAMMNCARLLRHLCSVRQRSNATYDFNNLTSIMEHLYNEEHIARDAQANVASAKANAEKEQGKRQPDGVPLPAQSWAQFLQHSDLQRQRKKQRKTKAREATPDEFVVEYFEKPPVVQTQMFDQMKSLIMAEANKQVQLILAENCPQCQPNSHGNSSTESMISSAHFSGFSAKSIKDITATKHTFHEIQPFKTDFGYSVNFAANTGRLISHTGGIYQLTVTMHVAVTPHNKAKRRLKRRDVVRILVCVQSLCEKHVSLEYTSGLDTNGAIFTINFTGLLHLEADQYASVFVDNGSGLTLTLLRGSTFSAVFLGQ